MEAALSQCDSRISVVRVFSTGRDMNVSAADGLLLSREVTAANERADDARIYMGDVQFQQVFRSTQVEQGRLDSVVTSDSCDGAHCSDERWGGSLTAANHQAWPGGY